MNNDREFLTNLTTILADLGRELNKGKVANLDWLNISIGWVSCSCCQGAEPSVAEIIGTRSDGSQEWLQTVLEDALEPYMQRVCELITSLSSDYRRVALKLSYEICCVTTR